MRHITVIGNCRKLGENSHGDLHFVIFIDLKNDVGHLIITDNDNTGSHTSQPIRLRPLVDVIARKADCFETEDLRNAIQDPNNRVGEGDNNNKGFAVAILKYIGFVEKRDNPRGTYRLSQVARAIVAEITANSTVSAVDAYNALLVLATSSLRSVQWLQARFGDGETD